MDKPFTIELANDILAGRVKGHFFTDDGNRVRILDTKAKGVYPVIAAIMDSTCEHEYAESFNTDGYGIRGYTRLVIEVEEKPNLSSNQNQDKVQKDVKNRIIIIISDFIGDDEVPILLENNLFKDFGFDSLDAVELAMKLENEFRIVIPDDDIWKEDVTVGDIIKYVEAKIG